VGQKNGPVSKVQNLEKKSSVVFVQPGAKINSVYYCDHILEAGLLPDIRRMSNDNFICQQDGAPAH